MAKRLPQDMDPDALNDLPCKQDQTCETSSLSKESRRLSEDLELQKEAGGGSASLCGAAFVGLIWSFRLEARVSNEYGR